MILARNRLAFLSLLASVLVGYAILPHERVAGQSTEFDFSNITNSAGFSSLRNFGGHGVQMADATGDGLLDIYVTHIGDDPKVSRQELFFINLGGGRFEERSLEAGVEDDGYYREKSEETHASVFADFDNDGDFDLFNAHTHTGNNRIYRNGGDGNFVDLTASAGIRITDLESRGVAAGDLNGDGRLDIVVSAWEDRRLVIYMNRGSFRFELKESFGIDGRELANQGIMLVDYDGDNDLDLAVTGWKSPNKPSGPIGLYRNQGNGNFIDATRQSNIRFDEEDTVNGWAFGDVDNDGDLDAVLVARWSSKLYFNEGNGTFRFGQNLPRGGFTAALGDLDHDGDLDIYFGGTGSVFRNNGKGHFAWSTTTGLANIGTNARGTSLGDIDNDGDLDISVVSKRGRNTLFRNNLNDDNWLQVVLRAPNGQAGAFGAKVTVYDAGHLNDPNHLKGFREARGSTGYCSQDSPVLHFGVAAQKSYDIKVRFQDGTVATRQGVIPPATVRIDGN